MNLFVDTSVWSLALRRTPPSTDPAVVLLGDCLQRGDIVITTGLILQELLQGFHGPSVREKLCRDFSLLPMIMPDVEDHMEAAELRNHCRRNGVQIGTIDALIARICIKHELPLLTTDQDFASMARHCPLALLD